MDDFKQLMQAQYLSYASYVIRDRAIPDVVDGLKPVQRRILETLRVMHDNKLHKVANVSGQTMTLHPHGDAAITDALITIANKNYLLDMQGNFGNIYTGDPAAASRYIETRLSKLSLATLFNPDLTETLPSYDGRRQEPIRLPVKIPLVLMHGIDGIAVGMSTHILPHNFVELLEAEIAILQGEKFSILPDFPTGGIMDASQYDNGKGKVKLRAKMEERDPKTIVITEVCYGTTTESLIRSIDEAAKRGKVKIDAINDYTSEKVEIEIKLPRGYYAADVMKALYAYTECEVTLHSQIVVIKDEYPWEPTVDEILHYHVEKLQGYLRRELEIERDQLLEKIFNKTLERIFIENRLYKKLETISSNDKIHETVAKSLEPYHKELLRVPTHEDREKLLNIPIRRISKFDLDKNQEEIAAAEEEVSQVDKHLKGLKRYTINYLKGLIAQFGTEYPRKTQVQEIEQIDKKEIATRTVKIGFDAAGGFIGTKVTGDDVATFECTNFDKLLLMSKDGTYRVINIPEKQYVNTDSKVVYAGVADKKTVMGVIYKDPKTLMGYAKRFIVTQYILDKVYRFIEEGMELQYLSSQPAFKVELQFVPKTQQKTSKMEFKIEDVLVKGVSAKGIRASNRQIKKVVLLK